MKTKFEIVRLTVVNKDDARPPEKLTVSYSGWWHMPKLHVPLALEMLSDDQCVTRTPGYVTLVQRFPSGKGPTFRVKGRANQLQIRLNVGRSLRTHAKVTVGDLVSNSTEGLAHVPFKENVDGKVARAYLSVAQIPPLATPLPPPREVHPLGYKRNHNSPPPLCTFPLGEYVPTEARLQFLAKEMCGSGPSYAGS